MLLNNVVLRELSRHSPERKVSCNRNLLLTRIVLKLYLFTSLYSPMYKQILDISNRTTYKKYLPKGHK